MCCAKRLPGSQPQVGAFRTHVQVVRDVIDALAGDLGYVDQACALLVPFESNLDKSAILCQPRNVALHLIGLSGTCVITVPYGRSTCYHAPDCEQMLTSEMQACRLRADRRRRCKQLCDSGA